MNNICQICNTDNAVGATRCTKCGASLVVVQSLPSQDIKIEINDASVFTKVVYIVVRSFGVLIMGIGIYSLVSIVYSMLFLSVPFNLSVVTLSVIPIILGLIIVSSSRGITKYILGGIK